jgi:hypothetical protein
LWLFSASLTGAISPPDSRVDSSGSGRVRWFWSIQS